MRHLTIAHVLLVLCLGIGVNCGQKKSGGGSSKSSDMKPAMGMGSMEAMAGDMRVTPGMTAAPAVTSGPTGIKECDALLDMLNTCHKKHPALKIAYKTVSKDAPGWKAKAQKQDPKQIAELAKACSRTTKEISSCFSCK